MSTNREILTMMSEATARMDQVIYIAGAIGEGDSIAEPLSEFLEENDEVIRACFPDIPQHVLDDLEGPAMLAEEAFLIWATTTGRLGFLIKFATPVMTFHDNASSESYSWGYYSCRYVYGDTFDDALKAGLAWVAQRRTAEKAKGKA